MSKPVLIVLSTILFAAAFVGLVFTPIVWAGITTGAGVGLMLASALCFAGGVIFAIKAVQAT